MIKLEHKLKVYKLWDTNGYTERTITYFSNEADAKTVARKLNGGKDYGYYGTSDVYLPSTVIFESVAEYEGYTNQSLKDKALSKLTKEEKQALGLL